MLNCVIDKPLRIGDINTCIYCEEFKFNNENYRDVEYCIAMYFINSLI